MRWLVRQGVNLHQVVEEAARLRFDDLLVMLAPALWPLHFHSKQYGFWIGSCTHGIAAAVRCGDEQVAAQLLAHRSRAYAEKGLYAEATADLDAAGELATD